MKAAEREVPGRMWREWKVLLMSINDIRKVQPNMQRGGGDSTTRRNGCGRLSQVEDPDDFSWRGGVPAGVDDDGAAELGLSVSRGPQHPRLTLCDGPAGADLSDHAAADVRAVRAVEHLADDDVGELGVGAGNEEFVSVQFYQL